MDEDDKDTAAFLKKAIEVVPGGIYIYNQKTQLNEFANPTGSSLLGYEVEEAQAYGDALLATLCHPDDIEDLVGYMDRIRAAADGEVLAQEYRMRHKEGHWVSLVSHDRVFERDADGSVLRHIGIATDISKQKQGEAAAEAARDELETIFDAVSSGLVALDRDGVIVNINSEARHMLGDISLETPFAWPSNIAFLEAGSLSPLDASADPVRRAMAGHKLSKETCLMRRGTDGEGERYVRVSSGMVDHPASGVHTVLVIDDVTGEERNRQVLERKSRLDALGQLTGGIAHDFNNLLAALLYSVELAGRAASDEKRASYLQSAASSIERGRALTARLLAFARKQQGLASVKVTRDVLSEFQALIRPMLEEQIALEVAADHDDLRHFCDQTQLETALMNLVLNARDAMMRAGKGDKVTIRARPVPAPDYRLNEAHQEEVPQDRQKDGPSNAFRYVQISVSDNGPGMEEETLARCTDPFFTTKSSTSGTGLGLAIVYGFVRQSGGSLKVYSELGIGTTVQMVVPRGAETGKREEAVAKEHSLRGSGQRILLVEDEPELLAMTTDILDDLGFEVLQASSGAQALEMTQSGVAFDLLFTDVVMPGQLGGFELARRVRDLRPDMPVIYSSGYTGFTASEMGAVQARLLQKPAPPAELTEAILSAMAEAG